MAEHKIYLTINLEDKDSPEWEDDENETPENAINFLVAEFRYRLGHIPGGYITSLEIE